MAFDEVGIANLALNRIGISVPIASLDELTTEAAQCKLLYPLSRDALLYEFDWGFASRYFALDLVEEDPNDDWLYSYRKPADCLRPRTLTVGGGRNEADPLPFALSGDDDGDLIFTDQQSPTLRYTALITEPTRFPSMFGQALAWRLASELAMCIAVSPAFRDRALQMDAQVASKAAALMFNSEVVDPPLDVESIRARNG